jgi:methylmalonyl-CoA mutase cobalamin-binding domain/chain
MIEAEEARGSRAQCLSFRHRRVPRIAAIVVAPDCAHGERSAASIGAALTELGVEVRYVGRERDPKRIAAFVVDNAADSIEVCLNSTGGGHFLLMLLRELTAVGRRHVSIVVHRAESLAAIPA